MTSEPIWWPQPQAGDILWCLFPEVTQREAASKPRPVLAITVFDDEAPQYRVHAVYGTSQRVNVLYAGEFAITPNDVRAFELAGLSYPTKFNFTRSVELPYDDTWFSVPAGAPHGQTPKLGVLHPGLIKKAAVAYEAASVGSSKR